MASPLRKEHEISPRLPEPQIVPYPQQPEVRPDLNPEVLPQKQMEIPEKDKDLECTPDSSPDATPQIPQTPETQPLHDLLSCARDLKTRDPVGI